MLKRLGAWCRGLAHNMGHVFAGLVCVGLVTLAVIVAYAQNPKGKPSAPAPVVEQPPIVPPKPEPARPPTKREHDAAPKDRPANDRSVKDQPAKDQPAKDQPAKDQPVKDQPVKDQPAKDQPAKDQPAKDQPAKDQPVKDQPVKDQPVKDQPVKDQPAKKQPVASEPAPLPPFPQWLAEVWPDAERKGVSRATFDAHTRSLTPDLTLPDLVLPGRPSDADKGQAEFVKPPAAYLSESSFQKLAADGRRVLADQGPLLAAIESQRGVSRYIVLGIYGRETAYGSYRLPHNTLRVVATQAYAGRRKGLFREEFLITLSLLERKLLTPAEMRSSWAGAMGPTQFMPSDYDQYAVDQDGDHKPNPWSSLPDALASAANQLVKNHWKGGRPWGLEVHLPPAFDCTLATADLLKTFTDWGRLGIKGVRGEPLPAKLAREEASLLMPAGTYGPAFLTTGNFLAVKAYNLSDLYALFVTHLADRIAGRGPYVEPWKKVIQLRERDVVFLQNRLTEAGFYSDRVDGKTGSRTRAAVGAWQKANGLPQDCWPTAAMLKHMQAAKRQ